MLGKVRFYSLRLRQNFGFSNVDIFKDDQIKQKGNWIPSNFPFLMSYHRVVNSVYTDLIGMSYLFVLLQMSN